MKYFSGVFFLMIIVITACENRPHVKKGDTDISENGGAVDSLLAAINKKIKDDPGNYAHYLERAKYYGSREKYDLAFRDIDRARQADSTKSDIYLYRGELHWFRQEVTDAYNDYKQCLTFNAKNIDCLLKKAAIDIVLKNYNLALEHINTALKENNNLAEGYYLKGRLYLATGDTTLSTSSYQTAIEVDPTFFDAYIEVGLIYATKHHDLAKEYYNSAIGLRPKSIEAWYNKAMFLQENGYREKDYYDQALICYDSIARIDPSFSSAYFNKGYIYLLHLKNYIEAIREFTAAINAYPMYSQAYYNRGLCFEALKKMKEAEADYRKALEINPGYDDAAHALSRVLGEK
ncbi:MAG: tetratricopeptide repeat protein [Crocinitomicaceae bacterium]|nr:tetratricopeptide repeat protein [Crocinitomicaceae bacterium]